MTRPGPPRETLTGWSPRAFALACVQQPLSTPVPADDAAFAARKGAIRLAVRTARRALLLRLSGQQARLQPRLERRWRRLLWVHEGMPQIGDAMMDLAPRSLLVEQGFSLDLFAAPHIAALFAGDAFFGRVLSEPGQLHATDYDAVIVLSHDRKSLQLKSTHLAALPWVSLQGFYGGPDFHRARFATRRIADLLEIAPSPEAFARHSAQKLVAAVDESNAVPTGRPGRIALALGGVRPERTYHRWSEVIVLLRECGASSFLLVGSENGRGLADALVAQFGAEFDWHDAVGRTGLRETCALLARSAAVVCADGGLMHLALTTAAPVVALFNAAIRPEWRVPIALNGAALQSTSAMVDGIPPQAVADAARHVIAGAATRVRRT